jgi:uncharacterized protein
MTWRKLTGEHIPDILSEVESLILREIAAGNHLRICIGTDSQVRGNTVEFATAIVFIRSGRGGFMLVNKEVMRHTGSLRQRMLEEVSRSVAIAYTLCPVLEAFDVPMEVHADINTDPQFSSNVALKEAMGYILGMGYAFRAKPEAFASSSCANKFVQ